MDFNSSLSDDKKIMEELPHWIWLKANRIKKEMEAQAFKDVLQKQLAPIRAVWYG